MRYEIVNQDVRYLRNECPERCTSVTGTGPGACFCCEQEEATPEPAPKPLRCCVTKVVVNNLRRYRATTSGTRITVCC